MDTKENELIKNNMGLAYELAFKYYTKLQHQLSLDDLQSVALLALVKAGNTFNLDLGYAFSTYAYAVIRNDILNYISNNFNSTAQSISTQISDDLELQDIIPATQDFEEKLIHKRLLISLMHEINSLKPFYRDILKYKLENCTFGQIAKYLGVSITYVKQCYYKAINILKFKLKDWRNDI